MNPIEYLETIKERLLTDPQVYQFEIIRQRLTQADGYLRARLVLMDGTTLEFAEYFQGSTDDSIATVTYSYHWAKEDGQLVQRWDNTPHFPSLPGFPDHVHLGSENSVIPGKPVNIFSVLDEIAKAL